MGKDVCDMAANNGRIGRLLDTRQDKMEESLTTISAVLPYHETCMLDLNAKEAATAACAEENQRNILKLQESALNGFGGDEAKQLIAKVEKIQESLARHDERMDGMQDYMHDTRIKVRALERAIDKSKH